MKTIIKLTRYGIISAARSRWILGYTAFFFLASEGLMRFGGDTSKAVASLLNVVLLLIPLVSIVIGTMTVYNNRDFTELLLSQPLRRGSLFAGQYLGLALPLTAAYLLGVGVPLLARIGSADSVTNTGLVLMLLASGTALTLIFTALALVVATRYDDRAFGLGAALLLWLLAAALYDGIMLAVIWTFRDYPLEMPVLAMSILNPIDLARTLVMLKFDVAALMGYTGAVFEKFFGTALGMSAAASALLFWILAPFGLGMKIFAKKDF
ncbi:MAG: ABC transporter permease subunit [Candidatus Kapabacteria bacterium]|nr:ABC transporter permease subunit [Candidatus Kapabacteria bacterium]